MNKNYLEGYDKGYQDGLNGRNCRYPEITTNLITHFPYCQKDKNITEGMEVDFNSLIFLEDDDIDGHLFFHTFNGWVIIDDSNHPNHRNLKMKIRFKKDE